MKIINYSNKGDRLRNRPRSTVWPPPQYYRYNVMYIADNHGWVVPFKKNNIGYVIKNLKRPTLRLLTTKQFTFLLIFM